MQVQTQINQNQGIHFTKNYIKLFDIWRVQKQIHIKFSKKQIKQKCIFLVGSTNVGKTTLLYYLTGLILKRQKNQNTQIVQMKAEQNYQNAIICNQSSTTQIPNIFSSNQQSQKQFCLIDLPGINDHKFLSVVSNVLAFQLIFQKLQTIKKVHLVWVISDEMIEGSSILENLRQMVKYFNIQQIKKVQCLSVIFTKVNENILQVKQKFYELLEGEVKQDVQAEEKQLFAFIQVLQELKQDQNIMFCFPESEPELEEGLKITQHILEKHRFFENDHKISILHQKFTQNILQSTKIVPDFQKDLGQLVQQVFEVTCEYITLAQNFVKICHKNFNKELFQSQQQFENTVVQFCKNSFAPFKSVQLVTIVNKLSEQKMLCYLDIKFSSLIKIFKQKQRDNLKSDKIGSEIYQTTNALKQIFQTIQNVFVSKEQNSFNQFIQNMLGLCSWLSEEFGSFLSKAIILPKMRSKIEDVENQLRNFKIQKCKQISENTQFIKSVKKYTTMSLDNDQSQQSQYSEVQSLTSQKLQNKGESQKIITLQTLKNLYIQTKGYDRANKILALKNSQNNESNKISLQQSQTIKLIIQQLQKQIIENVKHFQNPQITFTMQLQKQTLIFFQLKCIRHKYFLQSVLKNFNVYLKFFFYTHKKKYGNLKTQLDRFIQNLCRILDQYSLYQEQILIFIFCNNLSKAQDALSKGCSNYRIDERFLKQILIPSLETLFKNNMSKNQCQLLQNILVKSYSYLESNFCESKQLSQNYEYQLQQTLKRLNAVKNPVQSQFKEQKSIQSREPFRLNYNILKNPWFCPQKICQKIDLIYQRNQKSDIQQIYLKFISSQTI